jgi:DNA-directed RNA polymerase specialized sigma24 family protein
MSSHRTLISCFAKLSRRGPVRAAGRPDVRSMFRLREGEELSLDEIMDRWQGRLASYLFRLTGSETVALDLAEETFVRVYHNREGYRPAGAFSTWLFAIATNLARHHLRWRTRHPAVSMDARSEGGSSLRETLSAPGPDPSPLSRVRCPPPRAIPAIERICARKLLAGYGSGQMQPRDSLGRIG